MSRIGIVGAGAIGGALARLSVRHGFDVMISNSRGPETLLDLASQYGCRAGHVTDTALFAETVIIAIPLKNFRDLPPEPLAGKVVIDANNYYPQRDGIVPPLESRSTTTSEILAGHLKQARVVKAFNAIMASHIERDSRPAGSPDRRALPIAGDAPEAKRKVATFIDRIGFDVVDAGALSEGWRFERAKPAYCIPLKVGTLRVALAEARRDFDLPDGSWRKERALL